MKHLTLKEGTIVKEEGLQEYIKTITAQTKNEGVVIFLPSSYEGDKNRAKDLGGQGIHVVDTTEEGLAMLLGDNKPQYGHIRYEKESISNPKKGQTRFIQSLMIGTAFKMFGKDTPEIIQKYANKDYTVTYEGLTLNDIRDFYAADVGGKNGSVPIVHMLKPNKKGSTQYGYLRDAIKARKRDQESN